MMEEQQKHHNEALQLMSRARIKRSIERMSYQIAEDNGGASAILVVGLKQRGFAVARRLADHLKSISTTQVQLVQLAQSSADEALFKEDVLRNSESSFDYIIVVDDVIFSGRTMLSATTAILEHFNPAIIRTAALVDRGHRTLPVEATFAGLDMPTKLDEHVQVKISDGNLQEVVLTKKEH